MKKGCESFFSNYCEKFFQNFGKIGCRNLIKIVDDREVLGWTSENFRKIFRNFRRVRKLIERFSGYFIILRGFWESLLPSEKIENFFYKIWNIFKNWYLFTHKPPKSIDVCKNFAHFSRILWKFWRNLQKLSKKFSENLKKIANFFVTITAIQEILLFLINFGGTWDVQWKI